MPNQMRDLTYYNSLPYPAEVLASEEGGFVAHNPDLPGCAAQGEDVAEALENLAGARTLWLQAKWEDEDPIPEPTSVEPSGRLMLRVPIRLHSRLDALASAHGKSLNRLLNEMLFNYVNAVPAGRGLEAAEAVTGIATSTTGHYAYRLTPLPHGGFVAEHPDLPGCFSEGADATEAMANLDEARNLWIEGRKEEGLSIPEPLSAQHTGHINLRMPPSLHADLVLDAQRNGSTLNQMLGLTLAEAVGREEAAKKSRQIISEKQRQRIQSAAPFLRKDPEAECEEFLDLPESHVSFLRALVYLESRDHDNAFFHFSVAYYQGLEFSEVAVEIYRTFPQPLPVQEVYDVLLSILLARPSQGSGMESLHLPIHVFATGIRGNRLKQEETRRFARLRLLATN